MTHKPIAHRFAPIAILLLILFTGMGQVNRVEAQGPFSEAQMNKSFSPISISAGGISTLSVTIFNPNSFALILSTTPPAWTDTLPSGMNFASPLNPTTSCGGIVSAIGGVLSLSGGTVPPQVGATPGSCTVTVNVTSITAGNLVNTIPADTLQATDPTGTIPITNEPNSASATLQVNSVQAPTLSKTFTPNTIWVGDTSSLTITIRNNDPNYSLTQVALTDNLPSGVTVISASSSCGGTVTTTSSSLSLSGGSILSSSTCTLSATVTSSTPGTYTDNIPANAIQTQQGVTNAAAAAAPLNVQSVGIQKIFAPYEFQQGGTSTVTITLQNPSGNPYTGAAFTDNLPAGITLASAPASPQCDDPHNPGTSSVSGVAGGSTVSLKKGYIPAGSISSPGSCTIVFTVTSTIPATYTNTLPVGALTTDQGASNVLAATANLTVYATGLGVGGGKSFNPAVIPVGGVSRLSIAIAAPDDTDLTGFSLSDALPTYVQVASTPNPTTTNCGSLAFTPSAGDTLLSASGGTIPAGGTCTLAVNVTSNTPNAPGGWYTNIISPANISDNEHRDLPNNLTANLIVSGLAVSKAFYPPAVSPNGISTLTISLTNSNTVQLDNVSLGDTLPGNLTNGVVIATPPNATTTCPFGTVTATAGSQAISLAGAVIPAQVGAVPGLCTIVLDVVGVGTSTTYTNSIPTGTVSGTLHATSLVVYNPSPANANLTITLLDIGVNKSFNPVSVFGGTASTLTVLLTNPNTSALAGINFADSLPQSGLAGMSIANPPNFSVGTCGGTLSAAPDRKSFSFSGGSLAVNRSCSLTLSITMNFNGNLTNTIDVGTVKSRNGASNSQETDASLTNLAGASVSKFFLTNPIFAGVGNSANVNITILNTESFQLTGMGLIDQFPPGMTLASPPNASTTCGAGSLDTTNPNQISLTNGVLNGASSCTITFTVTAPAIGNYKNCIPANELSDDQNVHNPADACDTLSVTGPTSIAKAFAPNTIAAGSTSILTFTITNPPANTVPLTGVTFTDTLPTGVTLASVPNPAQCGGSVTSTSSPDSITLTGGTVDVNSTCTVTALVTAAAAGSYTNTSGNVSSDNGGTGNQASDTLTVTISPPAISKAFGAVQPGNLSTLTFTITNPNTSITLAGIAFTDPLPTNMQVANTPNSGTAGCSVSSTPVFSPSGGDTTLSFSSGSIAPGGTCTVHVDVTAPVGSYDNTSNPVTSTNGGTGNSASATLVVNAEGLSLLKSTTAVDFKAVGDTIPYSYLLTNTGTVPLYAPYAINDILATNLSCGSSPPSVLNPGDTWTCTGVHQVSPGDMSAKSVTNTATATAWTGSGGTGSQVTSNPSSVTVYLAGLTLTKTSSTISFHQAGDSIDYTYTLTNTGEVTLYQPFQVIDDHTGTFTCGSATSLAPLANITCSATYIVTSSDEANDFVTNLASSTANDSASQTVTSSPQQSVTVYEVKPPSISKVFSPNTIAVGDTSTLTFTITNPFGPPYPPGNQVPLTGVAYSDTFPSGVIVASAPNPSQCGGTVTSGTDWISLSGGTILANQTCTVTVTVTATTGGAMDNTSGTVTSRNGGDGNTASAILTVIAPPTISKAFSPSSITVNGTSTLSFTLVNPPSNTQDLTGVSFSDILPGSVVVATPSNANTSPDCGSPLFTASSGTGNLSFSGGTIAVGKTCTVTVDVTSASPGSFDNTTGPVSSTNGGTGTTSNTATLTVNSSVDLAVTKDDGNQAAERGEVLTYTIVVSNSGPSDAIGATVTDLIPSTLTAATWTCSHDASTSCSPGGSGNINDTVNIPNGEQVTYTLTATVSMSAASSIVNLVSVAPPAGETDSNLSNNVAKDIDTLDLLTIAKSASPSSYSAPNTLITYTYTITNSGTSTLTGPFPVTDSNPRLTLTCSAPGSLAPTEHFTCSASTTTTQADLDAGSITNQASTSGQDADNDTVTSNLVTLIVPAIQHKVLTLVKTITSGSTYVNVGDVINYSYLLTNSGNVDLVGSSGTSTPFTITDDFIGTPKGTPFDCDATTTSLAPGASVNCTSSYTITQADIDNTAVVNHANGHGEFINGVNVTNVTSNQASQTATGPTPNPVLTLQKSVDHIVTSYPGGTEFNQAGDVIFYDYLITNTGNVTLLGTGSGGRFSITDNLIGSILCPAGTTSLPPKAFLTCTASYTVLQSDLNAGKITNTATGHASYHSTAVTSSPSSQTVLGSQTPGLSLTKAITAGNPYSKAGDSITYQYTLTNTGNVTLTGPSGGRFTITDDHINSDTPFFCNSVTTLNPGANVVCNNTYLVVQGDVDSGSVTNTASGHGIFGATNVDTSPQSQTATATWVTSIHLTKTGTLDMTVVPPNTVANAGDQIHYTFTIQNTGFVTLSDITLTDPLVTISGGPITSLAPGASDSSTFTGSYTLTQADIDAGSVTNTATVYSLLPSGATGPQATSSTTVSIPQVDTLQLNKAITSGSPYSAVGNTIAYSYTLTNTGNVTLSGPFQVSDDHVSGPVACGSGTLVPLGTVSCSASYTATQADLDAGHVTNHANATANFKGTTVTSNTDQATANATQSPSLKLVKAITSGNPYSAVGDTLAYSYTLTNTGNVTLSAPFQVSDDHIGSPLGTRFDCGSQAHPLAPLGTLTCSGSYIITQADLDTGHVTNTAQGNATFGHSTIVTISVQASASAIQNPALHVVKSVTSSGPYLLGDTITYSTLITNAGNITLTNVSLTDSSAVLGTCTPTQPTTLAPTASMSCAATHVVTQIDLNTGSYSNTATATSTQSAPQSSTATVVFGTSTNTVSGTVFDDSNDNGLQDVGENGISGVTVSLDDQNHNLIAATTTASDGSYSFINQPPGIYIVVETIPVGYVSTTLDQVSVILSSGTHAVVNFGDLLTGASFSDPAVTKYSNITLAHVGDTVIFTITVGNNGSVNALNVRLTDTKPAFLDIQSINISPNSGFPVTISGNTFQIQFGTVTPTDFYTITVVTKVNKLASAPGADNVAVITTDTTPEPTFNDKAVVHISIPYSPVLPVTGFAPGKVTTLTAEPDDLYDTSTSMTIEIPTLGIRSTIVGVPQSDGIWDVSWLGDQVGYLEGTAFPTWPGNSVLTGHVYGADGLPGPFVNLKTLKWGDLVIIHFGGERYIYEVRTNEITAPTDTSIFEHQEYPWLTLLTCKDYNAQTNSYAHRVVVGAVLVEIEAEPPASTHPGSGR